MYLVTMHHVYLGPQTISGDERGRRKGGGGLLRRRTIRRSSNSCGMVNILNQNLEFLENAFSLGLHTAEGLGHLEK